MTSSKSFSPIVSWGSETGDPIRPSRRPSLGDLVLAARALTVAASTRVLMRLPFDRLARVLEPHRRHRPARPASPTQVGRILRVVDGTISRARVVLRPDCQTRAITRYWFLRRAGADVALCFGVGHDQGDVVGHCWVTQDGQALQEPEDLERFSEIFRIAAPGVATPVT